MIVFLFTQAVFSQFSEAKKKLHGEMEMHWKVLPHFPFGRLKICFDLKNCIIAVVLNQPFSFTIDLIFGKRNQLIGLH